MARQEQDFNKELNQQANHVVIKNSHNVTLDLTEIQSARVLQCLLTLYEKEKRESPNANTPAPERGRTLRGFLSRSSEEEPLVDREMQDVEVNSLLQRQSIHIENCTDVKITINQVEVERVVELGLEIVRLRQRRLGADTRDQGTDWA